MARAQYADAMKILMVFEGGKVDHPDDPGGRTNMGVIQRNFTAYLLRKGLPSRDVYTMTIAERDEIYRLEYANRVRFDDLPPGIDLVMLDGSVHSGVSQAVKWLQRALGITADGIIGATTLAHVEQHPDHDKLVASILERRMLFLRNLKGWKTFGKGWTSRINQLRSKAQAWASGSVGSAIVPVQGVMGKAYVTNAVAAPARAVGDLSAGGGGATTTITGGLEAAKETIAPMAGYAWADRILLMLMIAGIAITVFGVLYGIYARRRKAELEDALDLTPQDSPNNNAIVPVEQLDLSAAPNEYQGASAIKSI